MKHLYTRSPDIPGPSKSFHRSSLQGLFTRFLPKISMRDPYYRRSLQGLFARTLSIKGPYEMSQLPTKSPHRTSMRDLYTNLYGRSLLQEPLTRSLRKTSIGQGPYERSLYTRSPDISRPPGRDLYTISLISLDLLDLLTGALPRIPSQAPNETSLYRISWYPWTSQVSTWGISIQDLLNPWTSQVSSKELSTRSLHKTPKWDISTDSPGPPSSLHRSSLQDLPTRPLV